MTRNHAITQAGETLAVAERTVAQMTPREQAEAAWTPTCPVTVDQLEERIRARRGMPTTHDAKSA